MRISGDPEDPSHALYQQLIMENKIPWVFCDGKRVSHSIIADEEKGYVLALVRDVLGRPIVTADGKWMEEELTGEVVIVIMEKELLVNGIH